MFTVACCLLHAVLCVSSAARCLAARCALHVLCRTLSARTLSAACCLHARCRTERWLAGPGRPISPTSGSALACIHPAQQTACAHGPASVRRSARGCAGGRRAESCGSSGGGAATPGWSDGSFVAPCADNAGLFGDALRTAVLRILPEGTAAETSGGNFRLKLPTSGSFRRKGLRRKTCASRVVR
jgi:hypothetical protein